MSLESDLHDLIREATKLALRDELPAINREHLRFFLGQRLSTQA